MPALQLDDGSYLAEVTAICEYFEDKNPSPPLIGTTPEQKAECRMWTRRVDLNICEPMTNGYRFGEGLEFFKPRIVTLPEASAGLKKVAADRLKWLDGQMAGKDYLCGKRFTLADILLFCIMDFAAKVGKPVRSEQSKHRCMVRARCRASFRESLNEKSRARRRYCLGPMLRVPKQPC